MDFSASKAGPAGNVFAGLGKDWTDVLHRSESFEHLRRSVADRNAHRVGCFVTAACRYARTCSSERRLLLAVCTVCDFGHMADDLATGRAWQDITTGCDARYRAAIAACVMEAP